MIGSVALRAIDPAAPSLRWLAGLNSVGLSRLERIQLRLGEVTELDGLEGEYLGVTEGIRRRRVSIDEARAGASGNQTDVIRVVAGDAG